MNLCKIASAATIYHIWLQRKTMNPNRNVQIEGIFPAIKDDVRRVGVFFKRRQNCICFRSDLHFDARKQINSTDYWQLACYTNLCSFTALSEQFTYQHHLNCIFRCCNSNPEHKINRFTETKINSNRTLHILEIGLIFCPAYNQKCKLYLAKQY